MNVDSNSTSLWPPKLLGVEYMNMGVKYQCLMKFKVTLPLCIDYEFRCQLHLILASKIAWVWKYEYGCKIPMFDEVWSDISFKHRLWMWMLIAPHSGVHNCLNLKIWAWMQIPMINEVWTNFGFMHRLWMWIPIAPHCGLQNCLSLNIWIWVQNTNAWWNLKWHCLYA